jgi:hypothetical protein
MESLPMRKTDGCLPGFILVIPVLRVLTFGAETGILVLRSLDEGCRG